MERKGGVPRDAGQTVLAAGCQQPWPKVLAKFHGTRVPDDQSNLINVQDFATPVSQVEVFRQGNDTLFELSVNGQFDYR